MQGVWISIDMHVLPLVRINAILDNAWLKSFSSVIMNFEVMKIKLKLGRKKQIWTKVSPKEILLYSVAILEKLRKGIVECFAMVRVCKDQANKQVEKDNKVVAHCKDWLNLLKGVLMVYRHVLKVPTNLPWARHLDHQIQLKNETDPVNVPPYQYVRLKKGRLSSKQKKC